MRLCNECKDGILCTTCNNQISENRDFEGNLNEVKRHPPNDFGKMLPLNKVMFYDICIENNSRVCNC